MREFWRCSALGSRLPSVTWKTCTCPARPLRGPTRGMRRVSDVLEIGQRAAVAALEVEAVRVHATVWLRVGAMSLTLAQLEMLRSDIEVALDDALGSLGNVVLGFDASPAAQGTDFEFAMHTRLQAKPDCQRAQGLVPGAARRGLVAPDVGGHGQSRGDRVPRAARGDGLGCGKRRRDLGDGAWPGRLCMEICAM